MIISRTPYRISLGGGGTDLPFYSSLKGAFLISSAIDQYMFVIISNRPLDKKILIQTTDVQFVHSLEDINNEFIREVLRYFKVYDSIQVGTYSTIPTAGGIGLGSSSVLTVGLVRAISSYKNLKLTKLRIAEIAYEIERTILGKEGGFQDQYISALGGIKKFTSNRNGNIKYQDLKINYKNKNKLKKNFLLVYSNKERKSDQIIKSQKIDINKTLDSYDKIKKIGKQSERHLIDANIKKIGKLFDDHWEVKRLISSQMSNSQLDKQYENFKENGAVGGKLVGAGGGGFYLLAVDNKALILNEYIKLNKFIKINWSFDIKGSVLIDVK